VVDLIRTTSSTSFTWPATCSQPLGGNTTPLPIIYFATLCEGYIQMVLFIEQNPKIGTLIILELWTFISSSNQIFLEHVQGISYSLQKIFPRVYCSQSKMIWPYSKGKELLFKSLVPLKMNRDLTCLVSWKNI
jgi:hypothetical protein